ncbi:hypothetical protein NECAME_03589 [Necator americanus]|uniref:Uncharacterized protein n=1 Tax=Necator americanus TaxID=51031 RepID=W2T297_NECAM|nr:hypothetical protein NECAME_03589 [Necator americanus]ETN76023.1 hypothetical protein NECAME_03589 [Necator americanus]
MAAGHHGGHSDFHEHHGPPQMPFYGDFNFNIYGYGRHHDHLINSGFWHSTYDCSDLGMCSSEGLFQQLFLAHVCSLDASYAVYSYPHKRRVVQRDDYTQTSCDRCCKQAARLDNMKESEIIGMMLVKHHVAKCACCAPYRPYMDLLGIPVRYPPYQPQYQPYQQNPPPTYADPTYSNNNQPTGY